MSIDGAQLFENKQSDCWIYIWVVLDLAQMFAIKSDIWLGTADGPGMTYLNCLTGHSGAYGCGNHYYPALLKPVGYNIEGCDHDNDNGYMRQTGITKPSIFSGFPHHRTIEVPACFVGDLMHLVALNLTDLLVNLWCGKLDCDPKDNKSVWNWVCLTGDVWIEHGQRSFDHLLRNPADKINSGYKAWEYLTRIYGLGPNYCKLVRKFKNSHQLLVEFIEEFEELYYQESGSHFC
ncbi:hypothetical protein BDN70DRAFT_909069 [Pholiota conissans]|uniref:Uncharacterized protein n=1 Tax=Pholiota conissans TaxID=109636 RepID=A0A9P5YNZ5_9AGAR|nr:hypothetical protein BDN70DRAFT_909069 [Pholiota conissans]